MNMLPKAFIEQMEEILDAQEYARFLEALKKPTSTSLRLHPVKGPNLYSDAISIPWSHLGKKLLERPTFTKDPLFHAGGYYVQDASSQFVEFALCHVVDLKRSLKILDLCAAPGGKTTHVASLLSEKSILVANEVIHSRANILKENVWKWGYSNVLLTSADPAHLAKSRVEFDVLLVDAPCSGEGLFRKNPDAIQEWSPAHVAHCSSRQKRILADSWSMLADGGVLLYSTCTWNRQENEEVLSFMLDQFDAEMLMLPAQNDFPMHVSTHRGGNVFRFLPQHEMGEGYCIAALRKKSTYETTLSKPIKPQKQKEFAQAKPFISTYLEGKDWVSLLVGQEAFAVPSHVLPLVGEVQKAKVPLLSVGIPLAEVYGSRHEVKPHPMLPHSLHFQPERDWSVEVTEEEAIAYLSRRDISKEDLPVGRICVLYRGLPLGWGKAQNGRILSQYPMYYRIRKTFS